MADRELVIKIDEKLYKDIFSDAEIMIYGMRSGKTLLATLLRSIRDGVPLPRGHGRLIDADKLWDSYHNLDYDFYEALDLADAIIESDNESEEQV